MDDGQPRMCGTKYPLDERITCMRFGTYPIDWHVGVMVHKDGFREVVYWGADAVAWARRFGRPSYRILPIKEE